MSELTVLYYNHALVIMKHNESVWQYVSGDVNFCRCRIYQQCVEYLAKTCLVVH